MTKQFRVTIIGFLGLLTIFMLATTANASQQVSIRAKQRFIVHMFSKVEQVNEDILAQRRHLQELYRKLQSGKPLMPKATKWLVQLAQTYKISTPDYLLKPKTWQTLLARVNVVPPSLVIAQAVVQSNWGQAADAQANRDYFGMTHRSDSCQIDNKTEHPPHNVTVKFPSDLAAVKDYMNDVNTSADYADVRQLRAQAVQNKQMVSGLALTAGIKQCATHGKQYAEHLQNIIRQYNLNQYDQRLQELVKRKHRWWYF